MRVALIAESYLPHMNGVTGSVLHVRQHLERAGHETLVLAPRAAREDDSPGTRLLGSLPLPSYPQVRVVMARAARLAAVLRGFDADVVHLASPFVLGWQGLVAADMLGLPAVAVYQTDVIAYAAKYGVPQAAAIAASHTSRLHRRATLTLAPSAASVQRLAALGVDRLRLWGRGVDTELFAPHRRSDAWRARVAPGEIVVGYVGRLAAEKQVDDLAVLADLPGVRLVVVGDGPSRAHLEQALPDAVFLGHLSGTALAEAVAGFDVFVHPGESETFGQTIQEAKASGVPVVATGIGGPVDLVRSSVDGWLYRPGDLADLRARVADLVGDASKRRAFGEAALASVAGRSWAALGRDLEGHYAEARELRRIDRRLRVRARTRPDAPVTDAAPPRWSRFVALGDSLTEGLCDTSRVAQGEFRGWADRLAELLAHAAPGREPFRYANLAVRSRRIRDLRAEQLPRALSLRPDLLSIFMGSNDLVGRSAHPVALAAELADVVREVRASGIDVLLVTPVLPGRLSAGIFARRFALFNSELRRIALETGALLLDLEAHPEVSDLDMWASDRVHLCSAGHRFVAYRAAERLGVAHADALAGLDAALHADEPVAGRWLTRDALPWVWRRLRGQTAGDGRSAKHADYIEIPRGGSRRTTVAS